MMNATTFPDLPPLPPYELRPLPSLVPHIPDVLVPLILPILAYWGVSLFFHIIDVYDFFPQYRLHTPAEISARNHVSRYEVFRDVIVQQIIQTAFGLVLAYFEPQAMMGQDEYNVHVWAQRIRIAERAVPYALGLFGFNAPALGDSIAKRRPYLAGVLRGGHYPGLLMTVNWNGVVMSAPAFANWELKLASALYWTVIPLFQFVFAVFALDTWQYFWHRAMHLNKYLYSKQGHPLCIRDAKTSHSKLPLSTS